MCSIRHTLCFIYDEIKYIYGGGLSIKERRLYRRIHFTENVKFGYDKPKYNGISTGLSPDGMSIISYITLVPESNIIIDIYVSRAKLVDAEMMELITVEGEVIWVKHFPDAPSKMGIKFNKRSEKRLIRIYNSKKPRSKWSSNF